MDTGLLLCHSLSLKCPAEAHVLNACPPAEDTILGALEPSEGGKYM